MSDPEARARIKLESLERVRKLAFGDPVTNVCAGEGNPLRHAYFVRVLAATVEVTDKAGTFAKFGCEVIHPGHLAASEADKLFEPFWQAQYGSPTTVNPEHQS
jgi:hypothetical protein